MKSCKHNFQLNKLDKPIEPRNYGRFGGFISSPVGPMYVEIVCIKCGLIRHIPTRSESVTTKERIERFK